MNHLCLRCTRLWISDIMSQLDIFNGLIIFVFAGSYTNIHAFIIPLRTYGNQLYRSKYLELSTESCAYTFLGYSLVDKSSNPRGCWISVFSMCLKWRLTVEPEIMACLHSSRRESVRREGCKIMEVKNDKGNRESHGTSRQAYGRVL